VSNATPTPLTVPVVPREPSPQPVPAASGRTISLNQVADFAGKGKLQEELLLVGELKVVSRASRLHLPRRVPGPSCARLILRFLEPSALSPRFELSNSTEGGHHRAMERIR
jgi:hypothetical protein